MNYKLTAVIALMIIYLYEMLIRWLDWRSVKNPIPANVKDVYDQETYQKWRNYHGENSRFGIISGTAGTAAVLLLLISDAYAHFAGLFPDTPFMQMAGVLVLSSLTDIIGLPFAWYKTMVIEEKYGFNKTTPKTFWLDQLKSFLIGLALIIGVGSLLMWAHQRLGDWMIVVFAGIMTLVALFISFLYPVFSKVFNKFTPLEDGELKARLTAMLEKHGYHVRAIQVMDASRRSTKSNAYFTGFGKMKTIVLYDTLLAAMTPDEIMAVFAHEMGHGLHKDTLRNQALSFVQMLIVGALSWLTLRTPDIFPWFGFSKVNYGFALLLIMNVEFALISPLFGLIGNTLSRRAEYRADAQAAQEGYAEHLITGLKKLARENYADLAPDPLMVKLNYSHPTLSQRIDAIRRVRK